MTWTAQNYSFQFLVDFLYVHLHKDGFFGQVEDRRHIQLVVCVWMGSRVRGEADLHVAVVEDGEVELEEDVAVDLGPVVVVVGLDAADAHCFVIRDVISISAIGGYKRVAKEWRGIDMIAWHCGHTHCLRRWGPCWCRACS